MPTYKEKVCLGSQLWVSSMVHSSYCFRACGRSVERSKSAFLMARNQREETGVPQSPQRACHSALKIPSAMPLNFLPPPNSVKSKNAHKAFEEHSRSKTARPIFAKWLQSPSFILSVSSLFLTISIASFFISFLSSYPWGWLWIHNLPAPVSGVVEFTDMYSYARLILPLIPPPSFFFSFFFFLSSFLIETGVHVVQASLLLCSWCCVT